MDISNVASYLGSLAIVGVILSAFMQFVKQHLGGAWTLVGLALLSVVAGTIYFFLQAHTSWWVNVLAILSIANSTYNFLLQWFEKPAVS